MSLSQPLRNSQPPLNTARQHAAPLPNLCRFTGDRPAAGETVDCVACSRTCDLRELLLCRAIGPEARDRPRMASIAGEGRSPATDCRHRGSVIHHEPCTCGSRQKVEIHRCNHPAAMKSRCVITARDSVSIRDPDTRQAVTSCESCPLRESLQPPIGAIADSRRRWITTAELADDAVRLAGLLAGRCTSIIGVARSGMAPATIVAMMLHVPLLVLRENERDVVSAGHGWRIGNIKDRAKPDMGSHPIVIDDTTCTGGSFKNSLGILKEAGIDAETAVVYADPQSKHRPDLFVHALHRPHVLQWNVANSAYTDRIVWDIDGLICEDCPAGHDDDGPLYRAWLDGAVPRCLPRRSPITIATGRREEYRQQTMAWMHRHGVQVAALHMHPDGPRSGTSIIDHKIQACRAFIASGRANHPIRMMESEPGQAHAIEVAIRSRVYHC